MIWSVYVETKQGKTGLAKLVFEKNGIKVEEENGRELWGKIERHDISFNRTLAEKIIRELEGIEEVKRARIRAYSIVELFEYNVNKDSEDSKVELLEKDGER